MANAASDSNSSPTDDSALSDDSTLFDDIVNLCKRRGFVYPSAEIYGGFRSTYDYGPVGVLMLRNVKDAWWRSMVQLRHDVVGLDASILGPPAVWEASGHLQNFTDPLADCTSCGTRHRQDHLEEPDLCPNCGSRGTLTEPREFNLMFKTQAGPIAGAGADAYLRPETAQGMFINFGNILYTSRKKPPFGIAQIGKSFRNEITPGNFVFRTREFEQMEMEFFVPPAEAQDWYEYWCNERYQWYVDLGIDPEKLRMRPHDDDELSHYSSGTSDVEFLFPWGWGELEGVANRGDYDLTEHAKASGSKLEYFDQAAGERYVPHVIEPAAGATRTMMAFLMAAYYKEMVREEERVVLKLHHRIAPFKVAVLPLSKKPELSGPAKEFLGELQPHFMCDYDETQAIGKRYRRQDEIGTPYCITFDFDSLEDHAVTIRDRDSMEQDRIPMENVRTWLAKRLV